MTVLITGGTGLVGRAIGDLGRAGDVLVGSADADLRDMEQTRRLFARVQPDAVLHLAARVGGVGSNMQHPAGFYRDNALINLNVLEAAREHGVRKLVSMLATCIWPDCTTYPLTAAALHDGAPHHSNYGYAYAKRMLEVQTRTYRQEFGCAFVTVAGTNIYGPHDNFNLEDAHVLPALIHRCYLAKQRSEPFTVWGSGSPLREFVQVKDVARLLVWSLEHYDDDAPLILTSGIETSIRAVVELVADALDYRGGVVWDADKPDGQQRKPSDDAPLTMLLPDFQFTPVEQGVREMVAWFVAHYPNVRR